MYCCLIAIGNKLAGCTVSEVPTTITKSVGVGAFRKSIKFSGRDSPKNTMSGFTTAEHSHLIISPSFSFVSYSSIERKPCFLITSRYSFLSILEVYSKYINRFTIIRDIIDASLDTAKKLKKLILEPNIKSYELRKYLSNHHFEMERIYSEALNFSILNDIFSSLEEKAKVLLSIS